MQMTDSDFTLNDWRRRLGGGDAVLYFLVHVAHMIKVHISLHDCINCQ